MHTDPLGEKRRLVSLDQCNIECVLMYSVLQRMEIKQGVLAQEYSFNIENLFIKDPHIPDQLMIHAKAVYESNSNN